MSLEMAPRGKLRMEVWFGPSRSPAAHQCRCSPSTRCHRRSSGHRYASRRPRSPIARYTWSHWASYHPRQVELYVSDETTSSSVASDVEPAKASGTVSVAFDESNGDSYQAQAFLSRLIHGSLRQPIAERKPNSAIPGQTGRTFAAWGPFWPWLTSYWTLWFSSRLR